MTLNKDVFTVLSAVARLVLGLSFLREILSFVAVPHFKMISTHNHEQRVVV